MTLALLFVGSVAVWLLPVRYRFAGWMLVIMATVVPWRALQDHAHWERVRWVPFVSPPVRARDIAGNIALYVPFGFFYARQWRASSTVLTGASLALLLSVSTELSQLFSHARFPSVQDVLMNAVGATAGVMIARLTNAADLQNS